MEGGSFLFLRNIFMTSSRRFYLLVSFFIKVIQVETECRCNTSCRYENILSITFKSTDTKYQLCLPWLHYGVSIYFEVVHYVSVKSYFGRISLFQQNTLYTGHRLLCVYVTGNMWNQGFPVIPGHFRDFMKLLTQCRNKIHFFCRIMKSSDACI